MKSSIDRVLNFPESPRGANILGDLADVIPVSGDLLIKKIRPTEGDVLFALLQQNPDIPAHVAWAKDVAKEEDVIPELQRRSGTQMDGRYAIVAHGQITGAVWTFQGDQKGEFGIGYCLDKASRGRGYITDSVKVMIEQLKTIGAEQVYFQVMSTNAESAAVAQRLGCQPAETVMGVDFPVAQQRWRLSLA